LNDDEPPVAVTVTVHEPWGTPLWAEFAETVQVNVNGCIVTALDAGLTVMAVLVLSERNACINSDQFDGVISETDMRQW